MSIYQSGVLSKYRLLSFTISSPGSSHTYPAGDLDTYTFTGGFDKDVTIKFKYKRIWNISYYDLQWTPLTSKLEMDESSFPYTFRSTLPPHDKWNGFNISPVGWTYGLYNATRRDPTGPGDPGDPGDPNLNGIYAFTGSLPTIYRGTKDLNDFKNTSAELSLFPLYGVDVNNDGIADLFQNKSVFTVSKTVVKGMMTDPNMEFSYEATFKDVNGDPIKNWPITDSSGNTYTTNTDGKVSFTLKDKQSVTFKGMLPNMIVKVVEINARGMDAEHADSYNGITTYISGTDSGDIIIQDNTPLTVDFKNTDNRSITPTGISDDNTKTILAGTCVLLLLLISYLFYSHKGNRGKKGTSRKKGKKISEEIYTEEAKRNGTAERSTFADERAFSHSARDSTSILFSDRMAQSK